MINQPEPYMRIFTEKPCGFCQNPDHDGDHCPQIDHIRMRPSAAADRHEQPLERLRESCQGLGDRMFPIQNPPGSRKFSAVALIMVGITCFLGGIILTGSLLSPIRANLQIVQMQLARQQDETRKANAEIMQANEAYARQAAALTVCTDKVNGYRETLAQAQASAQQAAAVNPQAANMLRLIQIVSKLL